MSRCVPGWNLDDYNYTNSVAPDALSLDHQVAELTWENGQLAMHGLTPRVGQKPVATQAWEKPRAAGTLESIVNQATVGAKIDDVPPWFEDRRAFVNSASDALVPCNNIVGSQLENSSRVVESVPGIGTCAVGSCSGGLLARVGRTGNNASGSESGTCGGDSRPVTLDSGEREFGGGGLTSTSLWSSENTSTGGDTKTSGDDRDSVFHRRPQGKKKGNGKNTNLSKSRAAAIHNQSERKRRDKINQRMKTLQKLVPNSSKTDKASMLDEVIEYVKQLQSHLHMMTMPTMMMQQQFHMSMMAQAMGMGMGVMDINRAAAIPTPPAAYMQMMQPSNWDIQAAAADRLPVQPPDFLSTFVNAQSQPMTMDAYSRLAAMYQQFQQSSKN